MKPRHQPIQYRSNNRNSPSVLWTHAVVIKQIPLMLHAYVEASPNPSVMSTLQILSLERWLVSLKNLFSSSSAVGIHFKSSSWITGFLHGISACSCANITFYRIKLRFISYVIIYHYGVLTGTSIGEYLFLLGQLKFWWSPCCPQSFMLLGYTSISLIQRFCTVEITVFSKTCI